MKTRTICVSAAILLFASLAGGDTPKDSVAARTTWIKSKVDSEAGSLETLYKDLHLHPELSKQELRTAAKMAAEMKKLGLAVTSGVGGHGLVCILENGPGPKILIRTDLDALPIVEATGLPYASQERARDKAGNDVGVMHACGHDMHMTCWVGTARVLAANKDKWSGTLIFLGQPAEETGSGAMAMLKDGLFTKFPKPDLALALHCDSRLQVGKICFTEGLAMANVDSVDITVKGRGGHGSAPHSTVDPIVLAARIILDLQTIVSRETNPLDPCVVTVGSIHGGTKHNVIPNDVKLQITVRTTKDEVRKNTLDAIERIAKAAAVGAKAPEPIVKVDTDEFTPATVNEKGLTRKTVEILRKVLGDANVEERPPVMGGEDFGQYGRAGVPIFMFFLGTISPDRVAVATKEGATPLPSMHSDKYYPEIQPSLQNGIMSMCQAVLNICGK